MNISNNTIGNTYHSVYLQNAKCNLIISNNEIAHQDSMWISGDFSDKTVSITENTIDGAFACIYMTSTGGYGDISVHDNNLTGAMYPLYIKGLFSSGEINIHDNMIACLNTDDYHEGIWLNFDDTTDDINISGNTITGVCYGIHLQGDFSNAGISILDNTVDGKYTVILIDSDGNIKSLTMSKNKITAENESFTYCANIRVTCSIDYAVIRENTFDFANYDDGLVISAGILSYNIFVNYNMFFFRDTNIVRQSAGLDARGATYVNAQYNYWGTPYAPNSVDFRGVNTGMCYTYGYVDYSNWLGHEFVMEYNFGQNGGYSPLGIYSQSFSDLKVECPGLAIDFSRTYNSLSDNTGLFGRGWSFGFEGKCADYQYTFVLTDGTSQVLQFPYIKGVTLPDGSTLSFTLKNGVYEKAIHITGLSKMLTGPIH